MQACRKGQCVYQDFTLKIKHNDRVLEKFKPQQDFLTVFVTARYPAQRFLSVHVIVAKDRRSPEIALHKG